MPSLYTHLELSHHKHTKQLLHGANIKRPLRDIIIHHTKYLTIRSVANGDHWRMNDFISLLSYSRIEKLVLYDILTLSIDNILSMLYKMPCIQHIEFQYCHITHLSATKRRPVHDRKHTQSPSSFNVQNHPVRKLSFIWSDITHYAFPKILLPQITHLHLGATHNKYELLNDQIVSSLPTACPKLTHLTIELPQVKEDVLCDTIMNYGNQLEYFSVRCDSPRILATLLTYAVQIKSMTLRVTRKAYNKDPNNMMNQLLLKMILGCKDLHQLDLLSCTSENVSLILWDAVTSIQADLSLQERRSIEETLKGINEAYIRPSSVAQLSFTNQQSLDVKDIHLKNVGLVKIREALSPLRHILVDDLSFLDEV
ncbi:hypothetical protein BDB01DRAFT_854117 [Pilobolus umbonatus]|nr:hypothetical protein BDB01DRAFT_854117 [Pilobolus umbonatus]